MDNVTYHDRGIIKWAPFDALVGYHSLLKELRHRLGKSERPILSQDQLDELNLKLQQAWTKKSPIVVHYFDDGYTQTMSGNLLKLDWINKRIILEGRYVISANQIIEIDILEF